jgi:hypothetical protein
VTTHAPVLQLAVAPVGAVQVVPQVRQFVTVSSGVSQPSPFTALQFPYPAAHVSVQPVEPQTAVEFAPDAQTLPHVEQFASSVSTAAHAPPHNTCPPVHAVVHTPDTHRCVLVHVTPHAPQSRSSFA